MVEFLDNMTIIYNNLWSLALQIFNTCMSAPLLALSFGLALFRIVISFFNKLKHLF